MSVYAQLLSASRAPWHEIRAVPVLEVVHRYSGGVEEANYLRWSKGAVGAAAVLTPPGAAGDLNDRVEDDLAFLGAWHLTEGERWYDDDGGTSRLNEFAVYKTGIAEVLAILPASLVPWAWGALVSAELRARHGLQSGGWADGLAGEPPLGLRESLYRDLGEMTREAEIADREIRKVRATVCRQRDATRPLT